MSAYQAMQNKELFSPQNILVYDPKVGTCTIWTSEPSSDTRPASCLTVQERCHSLEVQRNPKEKKKILFFSMLYYLLVFKEVTNF